MMTRRAFWLCLASVLLISGCTGGDTDWHGKDISGLMPKLKFQLSNPEGQTVTAADSEGTIRLLYFGFTSCPDVCPTTLAKLEQAIRQLPEDEQEDITTLFVSVDPARDTPERLASYVAFFGKNVVGLTGDEAVLRQLAKRYRTTFGYDEPDAQGNYNVSHSSAVYVFDQAGEPRLLLRPDLSARQVGEDLEQLVQTQN